MAEKIIVKIGGSAITWKSATEFPLTMEEIKRRSRDYIRTEVIWRIGEEIQKAREEKDMQLIIINGVGPFGHFLGRNWKRLERVDIIHESVGFFSDKLVEILSAVDLNLKVIAPFDSCKYINKRFDISELWEMGAPILENNQILNSYGDIVPAPDGDGEYGVNGEYEIISGDDLIVLLNERWRADRIISITDKDGVFDKNPDTNEDARLVKVIKSSDDLRADFKSQLIDVTGGLKGKVEKLHGCGVKSQIINGLVPGNVQNALMGDENIGTLILPE